jgi:hypothetical protein
MAEGRRTKVAETAQDCLENGVKENIYFVPINLLSDVPRPSSKKSLPCRDLLQMHERQLARPWVDIDRTCSGAF